MQCMGSRLLSSATQASIFCIATFFRLPHTRRSSLLWSWGVSGDSMCPIAVPIHSDVKSFTMGCNIAICDGEICIVLIYPFWGFEKVELFCFAQSFSYAPIVKWIPMGAIIAAFWRTDGTPCHPTSRSHCPCCLLWMPPPQGCPMVHNHLWTLSEIISTLPMVKVHLIIQF